MKKPAKINDDIVGGEAVKSTEEMAKKVGGILLGKVTGLSARESMENDFYTYIDILFNWQKTHNIISSKFEQYDAWENIYDSLVFLTESEDLFYRDIIHQKDVIDAGAGNGFPGIPLAILFPQINFLLIDIDRKKCSFLRLAKAKLGLKNVVVMNDDIANRKHADFIVTKAAFSPARVGLLAKALRQGGGMVIWGNNMKEFAQALNPFGVVVSHYYDYSLPSGKKRSLMCFKKSEVF